MIMKKICIYAAAAVMILLSACENIQLQEPKSPEVTVSVGEVTKSQIFTATLSVDTKTYMEYDSNRNVYKTMWSEYDYITVMDAETGEEEVCYIVDGVGTSTATFAGSLEARKYVAMYGNDTYPGTRHNYLYLSTYQYPDDSDSFQRGRFPMIAQSDSKSFTFQNICSILKINVTGEGYLEGIKITTNDPDIYLSGDAEVYFSDNEPKLKFEYGYNDLNVGMYRELSSTPTEVYVVVPAQTYTGGLILEFEYSDYNYSTTRSRIAISEDVVMRRSRIRNLDINLSGEFVADRDWYLIAFNENGDPVAYQLTKDYDWYAFHGVYLEAYSTLYFYDNDNQTYYAMPTDQYIFDRCKTNTRVNLVSEEYAFRGVNLRSHGGYYDVYLDADGECFYLMSSGYSPYDLPTMDHVMYETYDYYDPYNSIWGNARDGDIVKVHGTVMAMNNDGYILAINDTYYNIFVYDPDNSYDMTLGCHIDIYANVQTYRGMKRLVVGDASCWCCKLVDQVRDYNSESPLFVDDITLFDSYRYDYISLVGTMKVEKSGGKTYYYIVDGEQTAYQVCLESSAQDLSGYNGTKVIVEGYFLGLSKSGTKNYLNLLVKRIYDYFDSSTEDVLPGGSFPVSR